FSGTRTFSVQSSGTSSSAVSLGYTLSGRVSLSGGSGVSGVAVALSDEAGQSWHVVTDSQGEYSLSDVAPGRYTVTPRKEGLEFLPAARGGEITTADVSGVDFMAQAP